MISAVATGMRSDSPTSPSSTTTSRTGPVRSPVSRSPVLGLMVGVEPRRRAEVGEADLGLLVGRRTRSRAAARRPSPGCPAPRRVANARWPRRATSATGAPSPLLRLCRPDEREQLRRVERQVGREVVVPISGVAHLTARSPPTTRATSQIAVSNARWTSYNPESSCAPRVRIPLRERALKGSNHVKAWRDHRFAKHYPGFEVQVLNASGHVAHGGTLLTTVSRHVPRRLRVRPARCGGPVASPLTEKRSNSVHGGIGLLGDDELPCLSNNGGPASSPLVVAHDTALRSRQRFVSLHRFEAEAGAATRAPAALTHDTRRARENGAHGNATN